MQTDIRDKKNISHFDITSLNFIRDNAGLYYRKYYRQGLRSHIMEVLKPDQVELEYKGMVQNGIRRFPKAAPLKILRIFRRKFSSFKCALKEINRYHLLKKYLQAGSFAESDEFFTDYFINGKKELLLCGFQDYIEGKALNPWDFSNIYEFSETLGFTKKDKREQNRIIQRVKDHCKELITGVKHLADQEGLIPDLAGLGNLILTPSGHLILVDINNISESGKGPDIPLDDKKYPAFDKSVEALSLLEQKIIGRHLDTTEPLYRTHLDPQRMKDVKALERAFYSSLRFRA